MVTKFILKITFISCIPHCMFAMQEEDVKARNIRFNDAMRGTQYEHINQETSRIAQLEQELTELKKVLITNINNGSPNNARKITLGKPISHETIEQELDTIQRTELLRNAPLKLKKKLRLLEEPEEFESDIFILHGPPGSGKSSTAKLIAYIAKSPFMFLKSSGLGDSYRNSPQEFIDELFQPLIKSKEKTVVILDELTGFTDKFEDRNSGESGAVQHLWTTFDECIQNSKVLIVATLNDIKRLPAPLRGRCREYYIEYPGYESRLNTPNHYFSTCASKNLILELAKKSDTFCLRQIQRVYKLANENLRNRQLEKENKTLQLNDEDLQDAFKEVYDEHSQKIKQEFWDKWKKIFKEYGPILIIPLIRMGCDYAIQHAYHQQQVTWNEECFRENKDIQERHHEENLKMSERHHQDNMKLQSKHNSEIKSKQNSISWSPIIGAAASGIITACGLPPGMGAAAGLVASSATQTSSEWGKYVLMFPQYTAENLNKYANSIGTKLAWIFIKHPSKK